MSGKKFIKSTINWVSLAEKVPEHQKSLFISFKSKSDAYLRKVQNLPDSLPPIDWNYYKEKVPIPGLVEDFEKRYGEVQIPYPPDNISHNIDNLEKEIRRDIDKFKEESNARIAQYKQRLNHLNSLVPFNEMTMEDYKDAFPDDAIDPLKRPTFWPHTPEEQLGYEEKLAAERAALEADERATKEAADREKAALEQKAEAEKSEESEKGKKKS